MNETDDVQSRLEAANAEIERLTAEVARLGEENRAFVRSMRIMTVASEEVLAEARAEAAETLARAATEAYERLVVARADARDAMQLERERLEADRTTLSQLRASVAEEQRSLQRYHASLGGRVRQLVHAMVQFADRAPALAAGDENDRNVIDAAAEEQVDATAVPDPAEHAGEEMEEAFAAFFSDLDVEPSRSWILSES
jgi:cell division septum initiation protein DivIVA